LPQYPAVLAVCKEKAAAKFGYNGLPRVTKVGLFGLLPDMAEFGECGNFAGESPMRAWALLIVWLAWPTFAPGLTIDAFDAGGISRGPELTDFVTTQEGLPTTSVIGGARQWVMLYGGSLNVDASVKKSLTLDHDRGFFEVANIRYGALNSGATMAPLNANLTAGGSTQITLRIRRMQIVADEGATSPLDIAINLRSGAGEPDATGAAAYVLPRNSTEPYVVQIPLANFQATQGTLNLSDIDGIGVSFFFHGRGVIEIDDISTTAGLPGDYNLNGTVDAADYTVWRDRKGQLTALPNSNPAALTPGVVDDEDFAFWKSRFGAGFPAGSAATLGAAVPEPNIFLLAIGAVVTLLAFVRVR
jgi:hypothetical protein